MSTIAVNAITDASGGSTTSINGITPNAYNTVGKNLVINGAMQIAQRGTSETGITTNGYHTCDRWLNNINALGTWTSEQSTDAPDGFSNSLKLSCTTADASPAAADYVIVQHRIEGQSVQQLAKGTASAKSITLSFWVKCNKTGDMQVDLFDNDNSRIIGNTVTINTADTWEKKTITFTGDTTGALDNDNNFSLMIEWWLDSGTDWSSGTTPTTWQSNTIADRNAGGTLALGDSTSNYVNITGVQLEVGESATEFEHRPYGMELQLCQRYYYQSACAIGSTSLDYEWMFPLTTANNYRRGQFKHPVIMRSAPSISDLNIRVNDSSTVTNGTAYYITVASWSASRTAGATNEYNAVNGYKVDAEL